MASKSTDRRRVQARALYLSLRGLPAGTAVTVRRANGETLDTVTECRPWFDRGGAYVRVRGISGNTRLDRVTPKGGK